MEAGLSQRKLAFEGCTPAYISRLEAGARIPSLQLLHELARRLHTTAEYLATGDAAPRVASLLLEAQAAARLDELDVAAELYQRILDAEPAVEEARSARMGLAEVATRRGDPRATVSLLRGVLDGNEDAIELEEYAWAADRLGRAYAQLGEYESSLAVFDRALRRARAGNDDLAVLRFSTLLANTVLDGGNVGRAQELLAEALNVADQAIDPVDLARVWWSQSRLHIQAQRPEIAARYARKAIDLLDASEHTGFAAAAFQLLARIENDSGNGAEALDLIERGEAAATISGSRYYLALFELERARALVLLGETVEAGSVAMRTAALLEETNPAETGRGYSVLADVFRALGDDARAREIYELAAERLPEGDPFQADVHTALGELLEAQGLTDQALAAYKRAAQSRTSARTLG